ncbi:MAG: hypothetical protein FWC60_07430 [Firmicutes bacterium]|nr:hypothetical protein [Bacillota bacterium]
MQAKLKGGEDVTDSVGLLISILVRYPQVAAINFDPEEHLLKFDFICARAVEENEMRQFETYLLDHIQTLNFLEKKDLSLIEVTHQVFNDLTVIEIKRDVETLALDEINLVAEVFYQYWEKDLIADAGEHLIEEELIVQDEIIEHMLESVRGSVGSKKLYAFREEGKVLVFNK